MTYSSQCVYIHVTSTLNAHVLNYKCAGSLRESTNKLKQVPIAGNSRVAISSAEVSRCRRRLWSLPVVGTARR